MHYLLVDKGDSVQLLVVVNCGRLPLYINITFLCSFLLTIAVHAGCETLSLPAFSPYTFLHTVVQSGRSLDTYPYNKMSNRHRLRFHLFDLGL